MSALWDAKRNWSRVEKILSHRHRLGVVCLTGIGGVGKTALALEIAHRQFEKHTRQLPEERFEAIVWVTAKQAELLPAGIMARNPTFTDLSDVYRAISEVLEQPAITRKITLADREVIVAQTLAEHRILLVLDNLEDIDDPALMVFLRDLPAPSKAIVTTRHRIDVAVPIQVHSFNDNEARELIRIESQRHNLNLTPEQEEKLLLRIGYLPLAIVRTLGRMAWRESNVEAELRQLGFLTNDIYDFCFKRSISLIQGSDAYRLFAALALFTSTTRDALGYVAGFYDAVLDRDEGLSKLEILSLVNKEDTRFSLEPLTKNKAIEELTADPLFENEARERQVEWYKQLSLQIEASHHPDYRIEISNLKTIVEWLFDQKQLAEASWFFRHLGKYLFAQGRWGILVRWAEHLIGWSEAKNDTELLTDMLNLSTNIFLSAIRFYSRKRIIAKHSALC